MTKEDDDFRDAIVDQLNAELGAQGMNIKALAEKIGRPYDSTRNYLRKERLMPLGSFLEIANGLGVDPEVIVARARERLQ